MTYLVDGILGKFYVPSKYSQNILTSVCWNVCSDNAFGNCIYYACKYTNNCHHMHWVHRHWLLLCGFNFNMHKWSGCKYEQTVCIGFKQCDIVHIQISQCTKMMQHNSQTIEM